MATKVAGELYESITGQLFEIGRQLRQPNGYPFDPIQLQVALQFAIEGKFGSIVVEAKATTSPTVLASLLEEVDSPLEMPALDRFVASEKLAVNTSASAELPISYLGNNLREHFLGLVEENVPAAMLQQRKLKKRSLDAPILAAHGDHDLTKITKARVFLAHAFNFLKTANRKRWYVFYVADANGLVWAVRADWRDGGWYLEAYSVSAPSTWRADRRVVSPQTLET